MQYIKITDEQLARLRDLVHDQVKSADKNEVAELEALEAQLDKAVQPHRMFAVVANELDKVIGPFPTEQVASEWAEKCLDPIPTNWRVDDFHSPEDAATALKELFDFD